MTSVLVFFVDKGLSSIHSLNFIVYYQNGMNKDKNCTVPGFLFCGNKLLKECRGSMGKKEVLLAMNVLRFNCRQFIYIICFNSIIHGTKAIEGDRRIRGFSIRGWPRPEKKFGKLKK